MMVQKDCGGEKDSKAEVSYEIKASLMIPIAKPLAPRKLAKRLYKCNKLAMQVGILIKCLSPERDGSTGVMRGVLPQCSSLKHIRGATACTKFTAKLPLKYFGWIQVCF